MSDDDDGDWGECDAVISCEMTAVWLLDPEGTGVLAELITDEGAYRIVWRLAQARELLTQLTEELAEFDDD